MTVLYDVNFTQFMYNLSIVNVYLLFSEEKSDISFIDGASYQETKTTDLVSDRKIDSGKLTEVKLSGPEGVPIPLPGASPGGGLGNARRNGGYRGNKIPGVDHNWKGGRLKSHNRPGKYHSCTTTGFPYLLLPSPKTWP